MGDYIWKKCGVIEREEEKLKNGFLSCFGHKILVLKREAH
jgi:hypothetical protein